MCRPYLNSPIPAGLSPPEITSLLKNFPTELEIPHSTSVMLIDVTDFVQTDNKITEEFSFKIENCLKRWGLRRFSFDWDKPFHAHINLMMYRLFLDIFNQAARSSNFPLPSLRHPHFYAHIKYLAELGFKSLKNHYKAQCRDPRILQTYYRDQVKRQASCSLQFPIYSFSEVLIVLLCRGVRNTSIISLTSAHQLILYQSSELTTIESWGTRLNRKLHMLLNLRVISKSSYLDGGLLKHLPYSKLLRAVSHSCLQPWEKTVIPDQSMSLLPYLHQNGLLFQPVSQLICIVQSSRI